MNEETLSMACVEVTNPEDHTYLVTGMGAGEAMNAKGEVQNPVLVFDAVNPKFISMDEDDSDMIVWDEEARKNGIQLVLVLPSKEALRGFTDNLIAHTFCPSLAEKVLSLIAEHENESK